MFIYLGFWQKQKVTTSWTNPKTLGPMTDLHNKSSSNPKTKTRTKVVLEPMLTPFGIPYET